MFKGEGARLFCVTTRRATIVFVLQLFVFLFTYFGIVEHVWCSGSETACDVCILYQHAWI